jgi:hypothetical protein
VWVEGLFSELRAERVPRSPSKDAPRGLHKGRVPAPILRVLLRPGAGCRVPPSTEKVALARRFVSSVLVAVVLATMMVLGTGTAMAAPFGPNQLPEGCVGGAAAPAAISNPEGGGGLAYLVNGPPESTPGLYMRDLATDECREEAGR